MALEICGCKGVRKCLLCENSHRVRSLLHNTEFDFSDKDHFLYCLPCDRAYRLDNERHLHSIEEIYSYRSLESCYWHKNSLPSNIACSQSLDRIVLILDFVNKTEEQQLITAIDSHQWTLSQSGRRKQDYGPQVNFKEHKVKLNYFVGFPDYGFFLLARMAQLNPESLASYTPLELCNLEYCPTRGSSIEFHIDDVWVWGERLISISLLSNSVMTLWQPDSKCILYVPIPQRSLLCMMGDQVRYAWKHALLRDHVTGRRVAITMREPENKFYWPGELYGSVGKQMIERAKIVIPTQFGSNASLCERTNA